ncbi:hypothetical protein BYT27DRAFT_7219391 [Phlegmacium glaucopus]|nr:hypothetical protein BYT27DRAFT_7219391 [Phlegmacium glaucopus]
MSASPSRLISLLLTTPYVLAYCIPLLLLSLILTFAGTFLTLDRSRSFPPSSEGVYAVLPTPGTFGKKQVERKFRWFLEGGVGGLLCGYAFGLHVSTALALIIPATTTSASLSPQAFLAVWLLSCILTTPIAGRYRYAAIIFAGISGGALTALPICVITHPSLPTRIILVAIFIPLFTILCLVAFIIPHLSPRFLHPVLRVCTASAGAFGVVLAIALLLSSKPGDASWANVWERLWVKDGSTWGTGGERGLSAAYSVFLVAGIVGDWALNRWVGECPDEVSGSLYPCSFAHWITGIKKWDNYLANYAAALPNQADRAGTFQPLTSFWDKIFPTSSLPSFSPSIMDKTRSKEDISPPDKFISSPATMHNLVLQSSGDLRKKTILSSLPGVVPTTVNFFKKPRSTKHGGFTKWKKNKALGLSETRRKPIKFGAVDDLSSGSDSSDSESDLDELRTKEGSEQKKKLPWASGSYSSSTPTLVDGRVGKEASKTLDHDIDSEIKKLKIQKQHVFQKDLDTLDYSDYEEDLSMVYRGGDRTPKVAAGTEDQDWHPGFLKRHHTTQLPTAEGLHRSQSVNPVPATPSLIKALDRIAVAQRDAFGPLPGIVVNGLPAPNVDAVGSPERRREIKSGGERAPRWEDFWREVRVKAQDRS